MAPSASNKHSKESANALTAPNLLSASRFHEAGLIAAIAADPLHESVLMNARMNALALERSLETGHVHYYSRSRQALWHKGEQSGHFQEIKSLHLDCDGDVLLLKVEQVGGIACHTGRASCFYRQYKDGECLATSPMIKDPADTYPAV